MPKRRVDPDHFVGAIHRGDDRLTRFDVLERAKCVDQLVAQPVEFGALTHDAFWFAPLQVEADQPADVARKGKKPGLLPIEHPSGPEST